MKKAYTKPELYTVEYTPNTGFCGQCADNYYTIQAFMEWPEDFKSAFIDAADGCSYHVQNHAGYCKYTSTTGTKLFTS